MGSQCWLMESLVRAPSEPSDLEDHLTFWGWGGATGPRHDLSGMLVGCRTYDVVVRWSLPGYRGDANACGTSLQVWLPQCQIAWWWAVLSCSTYSTYSTWVITSLRLSEFRLRAQHSNTPRVGAMLSRGGWVRWWNLLLVTCKRDTAATQTTADRIHHVGDIALDMLLCHF
jgi:hypothetical protein